MMKLEIITRFFENITPATEGNIGEGGCMSDKTFVMIEIAALAAFVAIYATGLILTIVLQYAR